MTPTVVVDVGNTRIKWGRCANNRVVEMVSLPHDDEAAWEQQRSLWHVPAESCWAVSGVQPAQRGRIERWLGAQHQDLVLLSAYDQLPLRVNVEHPARVGIDRLLNAVAINRVRNERSWACIIDAGTAVTVDFVDATGAFVGGAIFPGLRLMTRALHDYTALLPNVETFCLEPIPAKNTEDALRVGIAHALLGGIELLIQRITHGNPGSWEFFLGGGDAAILAPHLSRRPRIWPEMTLEGIRLGAQSSRRPFLDSQ
jgi:type III pantothenate kinase